MSTGDEHLPDCYRHPGRPTGLSCAECGRPICGDCMRPTPVGQRCPECAARQQTRVVRPRAVAASRPEATIALIVICVAALVLGGSGASMSGGGLGRFALVGQDVAAGKYYELVTSMFLHAGMIHLVVNMYALWILGPVLEMRYGTWRYLALYFISGLMGSAGALALTDARTATVGASGAIFGLMAALFVVERQHGVPFLGGVGAWIILNLVITFSIGGISVGGHLGGLLGGGLAGLAIETIGRPRGRATPAEVSILAGLAVAAVGIAVWFAHAGPISAVTG